MIPVPHMLAGLTITLALTLGCVLLAWLAVEIDAWKKRRRRRRK